MKRSGAIRATVPSAMRPVTSAGADCARRGGHNGSVSRGRTQRLIAAAYRRFGSRRLIQAAVGVGAAYAVVAAAATIGLVARYLRVPAGEALGFIAISVLLVGVAICAGLLPSRAVMRTIAGWSSLAPTAARAAATWPIVERGPLRFVSRVAVAQLAVQCTVMPVVIVARTGQPEYTGLFIALAISTTIAAVWLFEVFAIDLVFRPILEDVAAHLPEGFDPGRRAWRLRTKVMAPIPAVVLFTALAVGAFADATQDPPLRLAVTFAVAFVVVSIASVILLVVTRSTLDPLEELIAATHRVRAGDITTTVPLLGSDDLGELTNSFNQMLSGLGEREALRLRNTELDRALQTSLDEVRRSRARIVAAADDERRRVERDLHDGAQQHLLLVGLKLGLARRAVEQDPENAGAALDEVTGDLDRALAELRDLAHGIYPALLENAGLGPALAEAAAQAAIPAAVDCARPRRYPSEVEAAVYFCCVEALQNAAKHAGSGASATIILGESDGALTFAVADDGEGFAARSAPSRSGLQNMTDRIGALGGVLRVESSPGRGTRVDGHVPL